MARTKPIRGLNCAGEAHAGARLALLGRLREMINLREGALDFSGAEGVHAMRVASRRLRSALRDFHSVFPKRDLKRLAADGKQIADALGAVRDEDVAIIALEKLRRDAPPELQTGIERLASERAARRDVAREQLAKTIIAERLALLRQVFSDRLASFGEITLRELNGASDGGGADVNVVHYSFRQLGRERIKKQFARLAVRAACLYNPAASDALHELRIEAKRLRYALELFSTCWGRKLDSFAVQIADLQSALGELHDCDVWMSDLESKLVGYHRRAREDDKPSERNDDSPEESVAVSYPACVWLLDHFAKERTKHYRQALAIWADWQTSDFASRLTETLDKETVHRPRRGAPKAAANGEPASAATPQKLSSGARRSRAVTSRTAAKNSAPPGMKSAQADAPSDAKPSATSKRRPPQANSA